MANSISSFEKRLRSARLDHKADPFRQVVARLPKDWVGTRGFELAAGMALRIKPGSDVFAPVIRLFKIANLDHEVPWHWPLLLRLIVWAISEDSRGPGAEAKWTTAKKRELRSDLASLKLSKNHSLAAKHLKIRFPDKYANLKADYLRKVIARALLEVDSASLRAALPATNKPEATIADTINGIAAAIETEIDNEKALLEFAEGRPLDFDRKA